MVNRNRLLFGAMLCALLLLAAGLPRSPRASSGAQAGAQAGAADEAAARTEPADFRQIINRAKDEVFPAVVFIKCVSENFEGGKRVAHETSGSGVIVSATGEVVTNWHVVDKAIEVRCLLYDGRAMAAAVVGTDKSTDLALLQLKLPEGSPPLAYARVGDSTRLREGDFVMAMGAPWGLSRSVSLGIVSCTRRFLPDASEYSLWIQTDAAISPGNSGGPLVNTDGQVIAINARGMMAGGGDMGFAIPAETMAHVLPQLRKHGRVQWSWTGLHLQPIKDFNRNVYFEGTEGVIVASTDPESPARRAGIQPRDRVLRIDGRPVNALMEEDLPAVRLTLGLLPRDKPAKVLLLRDGKEVTVELTPREKGVVEGQELDCPRWDLTVKSINQFDNPELYFHRKQGVFIFGVKYPGNAARAGLQPQDILLRIDGKPVNTLDDVKALHKRALEAADDNDHRVMMTVLRGGLMKQVVVDFSHDDSRE